MDIYPTGTHIADRYEVVQGPRENPGLAGGMGIVYLCNDLKEERHVALKTFQPKFLPDRTSRDRFLREGTTWVDLGRHPHVVRCYNVVTHSFGSEVYLVLELVVKERGHANASLRAWFTPGRPLPMEQALLFALQIARGLAHATERIPGFVHRDLKPENVLVGADRLANTEVNRLRVTDFGLVRALAAGELLSSIGEGEPLSERPGLTRVGGVLGTPNYMAPEQWERTDVDLRADIYALGCILGEMLTGQILVRERTSQAFKRAHQEGRASEAVAGLQVKPADLLARCLAVEPGERYRTWGEVEAVLMAAYEEWADHPAPEAVAAAALDRAERVAVGWSHSEIGASYLIIGKAGVALRYFQQARDVGEAEAERWLEEAALANLGTAYLNLGEARRAVEFYEQRLTIVRQIGNRRTEGNALNSLGLAYTRLGDARRAIGYCEQALAIAREVGDRSGEGAALDCLGVAGTRLGDARRATGLHEQALAIWREIGDKVQECATSGNLGQAYFHLGEVQKAAEFYEQQLVTARGIAERRGEGNALGNLGNAYFQLGDARRAIGYYEQHLEIACEIGDRRGQGQALSNLGAAHFQLGEVRQAIEFFERALPITRELGDRIGKAAALGNLGSSYATLRDAPRAIGFIEQALAIRREIGDVGGAALDLFNMALLYQQQGKLEQALALAQQAAENWGKIGNPSVQSAHQLAARIQAAMMRLRSPQANPYQPASEAFQRAGSMNAMRSAVARFPFMTSPDFIASVEQAIAQQVPSHLKPEFEQRLTWLRQIAGEQE